MRLRSFCLSLLILLASQPLHAETFVRGFDWRRDTFAFSNDTVLEYGTDASGHLTMARKEEKARFAHRCFPMSRGVVQFHRFARFDPERPRVSEAEYRQLARRIFRIPAWRTPYPTAKRIVIPGFSDLHAFSATYEHLLKANIGNWIPTYLRPGNWRIIHPVPRSGQARLAQWLVERVDHGDLGVLYLFRIPWMNHVVVVFGYERLDGDDVRFTVFDPNYPNEKAPLYFRASESSFEFPERWYWTGGRVNAIRVYLSPFH
jgi:hypothetical protein